MRRGYVTSDLHLFAQRSSAHHYADTLHAAAAAGDFMVLNGDLFDFRWSSYETLNESIEAAAGWLLALARAHKRCRFFFVMGNHDGLAPFADRLDALASHLGNFDWSPTHVQLGERLFLHGDLALGGPLQSPFSRVLESGEAPRGKSANAAYAVAVNLRLHIGAQYVAPPKMAARRIYRSIERHRPNVLDEVTDIYFGHVHTPLTDYRYRGMAFHNTGAAIRGLSCEVLPVEL
jgi:UDP-2,3-diacylglucosamine hydrolase